MYANFEQLSMIGLQADRSICRPALSHEDLQARAWFADQIEEAGFLVQDDDAGNLSGVLRCTNPNAHTLLVGAHLDTVQHAGRYDGAVGMLAALECLCTIQEAGLQLPLHLEIIDFTDDEGTWQPMFGSMSLTGRLNIGRGDMGISSAFRAALTRAGINPAHVTRARRDPATVAGYIELHIEQGGRLEKTGVNIGIVNSIVGRKSYRVLFLGQTGHAGTASMVERRDALQGAALFVTRAHELVRTHFPDGVLNCGDLQVRPGTLTTVPGEANVIIESRHVDEEQLASMEVVLRELAQECAFATRVDTSFVCTNHIPAAHMAPEITEAIELACEINEVSSLHLPSYASHNAQVMSTFTPSGMLFIPSVNGLSHNPEEFSHWEDVVNGTNVLLHTIIQLGFSLP